LEEASQPGDAGGHRDLFEGRLGPVCESTILELAVGKHYAVSEDLSTSHHHRVRSLDPEKADFLFVRHPSAIQISHSR
jgi:hypothetical protein